jgi:hypothetical protein
MAVKMASIGELWLSLLFAGPVIVILVIDRILSPKRDIREPPVINPTIPYVGHVIGLVRKSGDYFKALR